jgi:hypothetical protein
MIPVGFFVGFWFFVLDLGRMIKNRGKKFFYEKRETKKENGSLNDRIGFLVITNGGNQEIEIV